MSLTSSSSSSNESSSNGTPPSPPRKMRSLNDLYEINNPIDNDVTLYCYLAIYPIVFEEEIKDEKWRISIAEEIESIKKNNIWKLVPRPKKKKANR